MIFSDAKSPTSSSFWLPLFLVVGGLLLAGCGATAPVINSINTPDTLETDESGRFRATLQNAQEAATPLTYSWQFGDGESATGQEVRHAYSSPGNYRVQFVVSNEGGADTSGASVTVVPPPQPASITSINATPNPVDEGERVRFSSNVQGDSPLSYNWSFGDGATASGQSPTHTYEEPGQYTVRLEASNNVGEDSRTLTVRVNRVLPEVCTTVSELNSAFFERNSSTLTKEARKSLQENADILSRCP
ncbi:MAG: PKD domain-containing protein, partial [Salinibacter sp.]